MSYQVYLSINGQDLPLPDQYELGFFDVVHTHETQAGTRQREVIRVGIAQIKVSFSCSPKWVRQLSKFCDQDRLEVSYFDTRTLALKQAWMSLENYQVDLVKDTSFGSLWQVSFQLTEL